MGKAKGAATAAQGTTNANDTAGASITEQPAAGAAGVPAGSSAVNDNTGADAGAALSAAGEAAADTSVAQTSSNSSAAAGAEAPPAGLRALVASLPDGDQKTAILAALDADAAQAQAAAAVVTDPLAVALKAPENISSLSIQGSEYQVNKHGLIEIAIEDAHHIAIALEHGFQRAVKAVRNIL